VGNIVRILQAQSKQTGTHQVTVTIVQKLCDGERFSSSLRKLFLHLETGIVLPSLHDGHSVLVTPKILFVAKCSVESWLDERGHSLVR